MPRKKGKGKKGKPKKTKEKGLPFPLIIIGAVILLISGAFLFVRYGERFFPPPLPEKKTTIPLPPEKGMRVVTVYFSNEKALALIGEKRKIVKGRLEEEAKGIINSLIQGPREGHTPPIPSGTTFLDIKIKDGIAFVNFSRELSLNHPGGSTAELQTVYSIVNSLTFNFSEIKRVQILIEGMKKDTLTGHIDISLPLEGDRELIEG